MDNIKLRRIIREEIKRLNEDTSYDMLTKYYANIVSSIVRSVAKYHKYDIEKLKKQETPRAGMAWAVFETVDSSDIYNTIEIIASHPGAPKPNDGIMILVKIVGGIAHVHGGRKIEFSYGWTVKDTLMIKEVSNWVLMNIK